MRAFVAIELPRDLRKEVARRVGKIRSKLPDARWVRSVNYHLTLFFLGEVSDEQLEEIDSRLRPVFSCRSRFEIRLVNSGTFPPKRPARVAWIGVEGSGALQMLQGAVSEACAEVVGGAEKRPFHAHLTIARCRRPWRRVDGEVWTRAFVGQLGEPFGVQEGVLMRSRLGSGGAQYDVVHHYPLMPE